MLERFQTLLYHLAEFSDTLVSQQLLHLTWLSAGIIFLAGLLTSLTPCTLSMLPIAVGYIGGYEGQNRWQGALQSFWFSLGLATTLAGFGVIAATFGKVYGQVGVGLPIAVSIVSILMGLYLLEALPLPLPASGGTDWISQKWPRAVRSYLLGLTFGLVASPCSTPVLATLLAWISTTEKPLLGGLLLLLYTTGFVAPLMVAGTFTAVITKLLSLRRWSGWIVPASGALLVSFGVFSLFLRVAPIWMG